MIPETKNPKLSRREEGKISFYPTRVSPDDELGKAINSLVNYPVTNVNYPKQGEEEITIFCHFQP
jgi:hypothetical protein